MSSSDSREKKEKIIKKKISRDNTQNQSNKGRKRKPKEEPMVDSINNFFHNGYISQDQTCQDLIEFFTKQGQVRIIQKTNQNKFIESTIMINKQLEHHPKYYFLSGQDNENYIMGEDGKLQDMSQYNYIDENTYPINLRSLIQKVNLCFPLLEPDFIIDLSKLIGRYAYYYDQYEDPLNFANLLAQDMRESQEYSYIKQWSEAKSLSRDSQLEISLSKFEQEKEKSSIKKSQKPKEKTESLIEAKLQDIIEEKTIQPLEYFIYKLIKIFQSEINDMENQKMKCQNIFGNDDKDYYM